MSDGDAQNGAWTSTFRHADGHGQSKSYMEVTRSRSRGDGFDEAGRKTAREILGIDHPQAMGSVTRSNLGLDADIMAKISTLFFTATMTDLEIASRLNE
jgi:hypothetical protein